MSGVLSFFSRMRLSESVMERHLAVVRDSVLEVCTLHALLCFGLYECNKATDQSDLDLVVVFKSEEECMRWSKILPTVRPIRDLAVDWLFYSKVEFANAVEHGGVATVIANEGIVLARK